MLTDEYSEETYLCSWTLRYLVACSFEVCCTAKRQLAHAGAVTALTLIMWHARTPDLLGAILTSSYIYSVLAVRCPSSTHVQSITWECRRRRSRSQGPKQESRGLIDVLRMAITCSLYVLIELANSRRQQYAATDDTKDQTFAILLDILQATIMLSRRHTRKYCIPIGDKVLLWFSIKRKLVNKAWLTMPFWEVGHDIIASTKVYACPI